MQIWIRAHSWDLSPKDCGSQAATLSRECSSAVPEKTESICLRWKWFFPEFLRCQHRRISASQSHKSNQVVQWKTEQMDGKETLPSFPSLLHFSFPTCQTGFSPRFVGFVFHEVYFHFLCFLGLIWFLMHLWNWRTPALSWEGCKNCAQFLSKSQIRSYNSPVPPNPADFTGVIPHKGNLPLW